MSSWLKKGKNCGKMVVENGLVDRDIGGSEANNDERMESFFNVYLSGQAFAGCRSNGGGCDSSTGIYGKLRNTPKIDVDQWLKNFAVYAITLGIDSPLVTGNNYYLATPGGASEAARAYRIVQYDHNNYAESGVTSMFCSAQCGSRGIHWSVARPTCRALEDHPFLGPLLAGKGNSDNMKKYLSYVKNFNENVYMNAELIAEIEAHASAIASAVKTDPGRAVSTVRDFDKELKAANGRWQDYNLLAFMRARGEEVKKQTDALDAGIFPRQNDQVPKWEACQDWRLKTPAPTAYQEDGKKCTHASIQCVRAAACFDETVWCDTKTGQFTNTALCGKATFCRNCFPFSMCGSKGAGLRTSTTTRPTSMAGSVNLNVTTTVRDDSSTTTLSGSVQSGAGSGDSGDGSISPLTVMVVVVVIILILGGGVFGLIFLHHKLQMKKYSMTKDASTVSRATITVSAI